MSARLRTALTLLLPALFFLAVQGRSLDYAFVWTDDAEIQQGSLIRPPGELLAAFAQPLHANLDLRLANVPQSYYRPLHVVLVSAIDAGVGREPRNFRLASFALGAATMSLFTGFAWLLLLSSHGSTPSTRPGSCRSRVATRACVGRERPAPGSRRFRAKTCAAPHSNPQSCKCTRFCAKTRHRCAESDRRDEKSPA